MTSETPGNSCRATQAKPAAKAAPKAKKAASAQTEASKAKAAATKARRAANGPARVALGDGWWKSSNWPCGRKGFHRASLTSSPPGRGAPWKWLFSNHKGNGYCDRWGYTFAVLTTDAGVRY
jgi:hypothetical protein